jgi:hypothetical protein
VSKSFDLCKQKRALEERSLSRAHDIHPSTQKGVKMYRQNTTVSLSTGRVHKHTETFARRVVRTMTSEKTPGATRRRLREALVSLFACTDIDRRRSLNRVENVAAVLGCTGLYHLDKSYAEARSARLALCGVMEDYDREVRPWLYPWLKGEERPAARRAKRPAKMTAPPASPIMRATA